MSREYLSEFCYTGENASCQPALPTTRRVQPIPYFDFIAAVGIVIADLPVVVGLIGAVIFLLTTLVGRSPRVLPERIKLWAVGGNAFAIIFLGALYASSLSVAEIGILFRMPVELAHSLLAVSLLLLLESWLLRQRKKARLRNMRRDG